MTKKKRAQEPRGPNGSVTEPQPLSATTQLPEPKPVASPDPFGSSTKPKAAGASISALIICRNKHWRYISSFHGPWLQLPPEVLESLAYSNYVSPRPHPIDPAVFFDLVKIRRLVEEATNLAVRATNGTTSSTLSTSMNAGNGLFGGGGSAAVGLGIGVGGGNAKLSKERKHRMRESATQKLSEAYNLDEIAASVATMQSASPLEDVAKLVLQRNSNDVDAKYVHFFHEKIPSRMLSQCTSLAPLDDIIRDRPGDGALLRTRAITRILKNEFPGAVRDLSEALTLCRHSKLEHVRGRRQRQYSNALGGIEMKHGSTERLGYDMNVDQISGPTSLEQQLLFHRAGVYLTRACQYIKAALNGLDTNAIPATKVGIDSVNVSNATEGSGIDEAKLRDGARKLVKTFAKRALRDYIGFLASFDYTPGLPPEVAEGFFRKVITAANGGSRSAPLHCSRLLEMSGNSSLSNGTLSEALARTDLKSEGHHYDYSNNYKHDLSQSIPAPIVHCVADLFSSSPPDNIPPYPVNLQSLVHRAQIGSSTASESTKRFLTDPMYHEAVTYHPLLTDALHSVLLCHSLMQTSAKEHLRHAHMVARLARVCDGYPIFLAARSPSRADWIEVIRRANNWIELQQSWEVLCAPAPLPGQMISSKEETAEEVKERRRQEAIMEALADERVHDEVSFQAAVAAREKLAEELNLEEQRSVIEGPKRWAQSDGKEYPISTERAEAIARWVREAPSGVEMARTSKGTRKNIRLNHSLRSSEPDAMLSNDESSVIVTG
ncbi:hypothetical protein MMC11_006800 [Xylographa trunciseda]|nr:hypothetical protein [Xylographa trunciseda]